jgi:hypothetical protein
LEKYLYILLASIFVAPGTIGENNARLNRSDNPPGNKKAKEESC